MAKLNSAEESVLNEITAWKAEGPGLVNKATSFLSRPLNWVYDELVPTDAKAKMDELTEKLLDKLQDVSQWTVNEEDVLKSVREFEIDSNTIIELQKASIFDLDHVAEGYLKQNKTVAAAGGFGTGLVGWAGLVADLPTLFTVCFRMIYQISLSYGYPLSESRNTDEDEFEIGFMLRAFNIGTASSLKDKIAGLQDLKDFEIDSRTALSGKIGKEFTTRTISKTAAIQVSRSLVTKIVQQTMARKAITMIPAIGALLNAGFNYSYVSDVGQAAWMLYRERFLLDKKGRTKSVIITID